MDPEANQSERHKVLSVECFNGVWGLLDKTDRSEEDNRLMREMAHASLFHWMKREDCTPQNLSVGLWQVSRVYAVLGEPESSMRYARECIEVSDEASLPPFYRAYGYEAATRAAHLMGDHAECSAHLTRCQDLIEDISDDEERRLVEEDLKTIPSDH